MPSDNASDLYIDLMERCILGLIYEDPAQDPWSAHIFDKAKRTRGLDWPLCAHSMIGKLRMDNLRAAVEHVIRTNIPGDLIETGAWRGGACIFMRSILKAYAIPNRIVWVADSFQGLPIPNPEKYPADAGDRHHTFKQLAVSLEEVQGNFAKYGLLDEQVRFLVGWFKDTLPAAPIERLAILRLDGDIYESTMDALVSLYTKVSPGGVIIVDDYGAIPACQKAIHDFRKANRILDPIQPIDGLGVYWTLHVALAWRLGWPVSLACVWAHLIARYDDGHTTHNIEATNNGRGGFHSHPDQYYQSNYFIPNEAILSGSDLTSLSSRQMLGIFFGFRARHRADLGQLEEPGEDFLRARAFFPESRYLLKKSKEVSEPSLNPL